MTNSLAHEILFDNQGENIRLDLLFESKTPCTYEITSHDSRGMYQGTIMKGNNLSGPADRFHIPTNITELDQRLIGWHIIFGAPMDGEENKYSASIRFSQGGDQFLSDKICDTGFHKTEKVIIGFARFMAHADFSKSQFKPKKQPSPTSNRSNLLS